MEFLFQVGERGGGFKRSTWGSRRWPRTMYWRRNQRSSLWESWRRRRGLPSRWRKRTSPSFHPRPSSSTCGEKVGLVLFWWFWYLQIKQDLKKYFLLTCLQAESSVLQFLSCAVTAIWSLLSLQPLHSRSYHRLELELEPTWWSCRGRWSCHCSSSRKPRCRHHRVHAGRDLATPWSTLICSDEERQLTSVMFGMFSVEQAVFTLASQPLRSAARSVKFFVTWQLLVTIHRRWWTLPLTEWSSWNFDRAPSWWSLISSATSKSLKCLLKISVNQYIIIIFFAKVLVSPALHHPLCLDSARLAHVSARNVVVWAPSSTQLRKTSHHNRVLPRESNWDSTAIHNCTFSCWQHKLNRHCRILSSNIWKYQLQNSNWMY